METTSEKLKAGKYLFAVQILLPSSVVPLGTVVLRSCSIEQVSIFRDVILIRTQSTLVFMGSDRSAVQVHLN